MNRSKDNVKRKENFVPIKVVQPDSVVKEGSYFERSLLEPTLTLKESLDQTATISITLLLFITSTGVVISMCSLISRYFALMQLFSEENVSNESQLAEAELDTRMETLCLSVTDYALGLDK